jgi:hypothetical protein
MASSETILAGSTSATNVTLRNDDTGSLTVLKDATQIFKVDAYGNVGLGGNPTNTSNYTKLAISGSSGGILDLYSGATQHFRAYCGGSGTYLGTTSNTPLIFTTNDQTKMTLTAGGNLQLDCQNATESGWDGIEGLRLNGDAASAAGIVFTNNGVNRGYLYYAGGIPSLFMQTTAGNRIDMQSSTQGVYLANGGTSWTANSDERVKDIIEPISDAVSKVYSLRTVIGKYKNDDEGTRRAFLIAQDVLAVLPEAVDTSNPECFGVQYSDLIPLALAAIKELSAKNDALEARLLALETK